MEKHKNGKVEWTLLDESACCRNCGKPMKTNLLLRNPLATLCYTCWMVNVRGKSVKTKFVKVKKSEETITQQVTVRLAKIIEANRKKYRHNKKGRRK